MEISDGGLNISISILFSNSLQHLQYGTNYILFTFNKTIFYIVVVLIMSVANSHKTSGATKLAQYKFTFRQNHGLL